MNNLKPVDVKRIISRATVKKADPVVIDNKEKVKFIGDGTFYPSNLSRIKKRLLDFNKIRKNSLEYLLIQEINYLQDNKKVEELPKEKWECHWCSKKCSGEKKYDDDNECLCKSCYWDFLEDKKKEQLNGRNENNEYKCTDDNGNVYHLKLDEPNKKVKVLNEELDGYGDFHLDITNDNNLKIKHIFTNFRLIYTLKDGEFKNPLIINKKNNNE